MAFERIPLGHITVPAGRRPLTERNVMALMESMEQNGLQEPIGVRVGGDLIWGRHRLEAARRLAWTEIDCNVIETTDIGARLMEIDENLVHEPLSPAERVTAMAERKDLYEALHPETKHGGNVTDRERRPDGTLGGQSATSGNSGSRPLSFIADTAQKTGYSKAKIARDVRIGKAFTREEIERMGEAKVPVQGMDLLAARRKGEPAAVAAVLAEPTDRLRAAALRLVGKFDGNRAARGKAPVAAAAKPPNTPWVAPVLEQRAVWEKDGITEQRSPRGNNRKYVFTFTFSCRSLAGGARILRSYLTENELEAFIHELRNPSIATYPPFDEEDWTPRDGGMDQSG